MTNSSASRKQARRFWHAMALMRRSSPWRDSRSVTRTDSVTRRESSLSRDARSAAGSALTAGPIIVGTGGRSSFGIIRTQMSVLVSTAPRVPAPLFALRPCR